MPVFKSDTNEIKGLNYIAIRNSSAEISPYTPTQSDMLAKDWFQIKLY